MITWDVMEAGECSGYSYELVTGHKWKHDNNTGMMLHDGNYHQAICFDKVDELDDRYYLFLLDFESSEYRLVAILYKEYNKINNIGDYK